MGELVAEAKRRLQVATRAPAEPDDLDSDAVAELRGRGMRELLLARWSSAVPARFAHARLDDFDGEAYHGALVDWSKRAGVRPNLVLLGPVGAGKSHAAVAACRGDFAAGLEVKFMPIVELLDLLRPGGPEGAYWDLCDVDRLIVDDVGQERATDWSGERFGAVLNRRWLEERPTIVTSNLEPDGLKAALGLRDFSRLARSGAVVVQMTGDDRRRS